MGLDKVVSISQTWNFSFINNIHRENPPIAIYCDFVNFAVKSEAE